MKLADKIVALRKSRGFSQEELAEKLQLSRQAVSRWEMGTAMPDAANILQLSKLFEVSTDYLLNDEYTNDNDLPQIKKVQKSSMQQNMVLFITLEGMTLLLQCITAFLLSNQFLTALFIILFVALLGCFEYSYQKYMGQTDNNIALLRKQFYKISAWLGLYFPIRLLTLALSPLYPRSLPSLLLEGIILGTYIIIASAGSFALSHRLS